MKDFKIIRYALEGILLNVAFILFRFMPVDVASNIGGLIGRTIGPKLAASRKALNNLKDTLPDTQNPEEIIQGMWDNLGRVIAEYPHLETIGKTRVKIEGIEHMLALKDGQPAIFISSHSANWEVIIPALLKQHNILFDFTYRAPNNPWSDKILMQARTMNGQVKGYPKSRQGGTALYKAMKAGRRAGILIDQKYNQGVQAEFFGKPAMTNPVFVQLAQKINAPVFPIRCERIMEDNGAHFALTIYPPLKTMNKDPATVIVEAHKHLEDWIKKSPAQWLWLHKRWG